MITAIGLVVAGKQLQRIDEAGADHRIAANADAGRLPHPVLRSWSMAS